MIPDDAAAQECQESEPEDHKIRRDGTGVRARTELVELCKEKPVERIKL